MTEKGRDLMPAIIALTEWGDKWVSPGPVEFMHKECGGHVRLCLCCTKCNGPVAVEQVEAAKVDQAT
ncbi:hypothetical protein JHW45_08190 [Paracoccus stylophorae]|uniref:Transcriptional regulator n=2 Tax=Paracoccus stylophorae TaxID=659350 RepID=A0ABY7SZC5_9RHOB|nr:hypothetical protein JHW45_08190 [Paracoccus stylophorae]